MAGRRRIFRRRLAQGAPSGRLPSDKAKPGKRVKYFGEYELLSEIARGGMGVVYKARQVKLNRIVGLKMILSGEFAGSEAVQRFHSEAEAVANPDHPGIVPIYEIGEHEDQHYRSMGFIDGLSLQSQLNAGHNFNCFVHAPFWTIAPPVL